MCKSVSKTLLSILLGVYPEVTFLGYMAVLFLVLGGTTMLFSVVAVQVTFPPAVWRVPTSSVEGSDFSTSPPALAFPVLFCFWMTTVLNAWESGIFLFLFAFL